MVKMVLVGQETEEQIRARAYNKRMQELEVRLHGPGCTPPTQRSRECFSCMRTRYLKVAVLG